MAAGIPARLTAAEGRKFAFTVGAAFLALAALLLWRDHERAATAAGALGGLLLLAGLVAPAHLGPVLRAWMGLALAISRVTTPIVMGVVYFLVIAPIGLVMRLFGRDPLEPPRDGASFWAPRPADARRSDMERQF